MLQPIYRGVIDFFSKCRAASLVQTARHFSADAENSLFAGQFVERVIPCRHPFPQMQHLEFLHLFFPCHFFLLFLCSPSKRLRPGAIL